MQTYQTYFKREFDKKRENSGVLARFVLFLSGIHKGDVGIVCFDEAVDDSMEVAFPTFDETGEERGDVSFAVKIKDLKLVLRRGESEPKDI